MSEIESMKPKPVSHFSKKQKIRVKTPGLTRPYMPPTTRGKCKSKHLFTNNILLDNYSYFLVQLT
jgi:hypothetical protein